MRKPSITKVAGATGLTIGLALGGYGFASATSSGPAPTPAASTRPTRPARPGLSAAAGALGMPVSDLESQLAGGQTIAAIAKARGVDINKVIDAMVAEAQPGLRQRITNEVNGTFHHRGRGPMGRMGRHAMRSEFGVAAGAIGISPADLATAVRGGQSVAEVAKAHNVDPQKVIDALVAAQTTRIDQAVKDGRITQAQGDARKAMLTQRVTALVNRVPGPGGTGRWGAPPA